MKLHILVDELMSKHNNPFMMKYERLDITSCYPVIMSTQCNRNIEGFIGSYQGGFIEGYKIAKKRVVVIK